MSHLDLNFNGWLVRINDSQVLSLPGADKWQVVEGLLTFYKGEHVCAVVKDWQFFHEVIATDADDSLQQRRRDVYR